MTLAFYSVSNSCGYGRHEFDGDEKAEIISKLSKLEDGEVKTYDMSQTGYASKEATASDFVDDYNDEILDGGGWWCVILN